MIAYYFPPLGGAGVQRTAKFAKYLARLGWRVEVVTVEPPAFELRDDSGLADVTSDLIHIRRLPYREKWRNFDRFPGGWRLRALFQDWLLFPDRMAAWMKPALAAASEICEANQDIAIYTTAGPYTAHLIGLYLKQRFHRPWVADFRDEWSQNPYLPLPARCLLFKHRHAERRVLRQADVVLTVTDTICNGLRSLAPGAGAQFEVIPNGFDPDDFQHLNSGSGAHEFFTITHVGTLNQERAKLLVPFIQQLNTLITSGELPETAMKLKLVGQGNYRELNLPDGGWVETVPYLPHHDALRIMSGSDMLVLAESNPAAFTGKIFEYLALKRPILGLVHSQSPAAKLIREAGAGWVMGTDLSNHQTRDMQRILLDCYRAKQNGTECCRYQPEAVARYNRENQAAQLAELIKGIISLR